MRGEQNGKRRREDLSRRVSVEKGSWRMEEIIQNELGIHEAGN